MRLAYLTAEYVARLDAGGNDAGSQALYKPGAHVRDIFMDASGGVVVAGLDDKGVIKACLARLAP